jgi:hypothetical protein
MKKSFFTKRINLNRETIANLTSQEMRESLAGGDKTEIGESCDTDINGCCTTKPPQCIDI